MSCSPTVPCVPWATLDNFMGDCKAKASLPDNVDLFQEMLNVATTTAFRLTQSRFTGTCQTTIMPLKKNSSCCGNIRYSGFWGQNGYPSYLQTRLIAYNTPIPTDCFGTGECNKADKIRLPYHPVCSVDEVILDGVILPDDEYYLKDQKYLCFVDPDRTWPTCQDFNDPQFTVKFTHGIDPPDDLVRHTLSYACELAKRELKEDCALPQRITIRDEAVILDPMTYVRNGQTGYAPLDACIKSINPSGSTRPARVVNVRKRRQSFSRPN